MKTADFLRKHDLWPKVYAGYQLEITGNRHIECPLCGGKKSFRIHNRTGNGDWICKCGHGTGLSLLMEITGKSFADIAKELDREFGNTEQAPRQQKPKDDKAEQTKQRFMSLHPIEGTDADDYLTARGLRSRPKLGVKFSRCEFDHEEQCEFPTMYAVATDDSYRIIYKHTTYLCGDKKAEGVTARKQHTIAQYDGSVAVRMMPSGDVLGIAEGIETALAAHQLYGVPTWAVLNAEIMKRFRAPPGTKHLIIYADNDPNGTGLAAAFECGSKNVIQGKAEKVTVKWPEHARKDFNDMIHEPMQTYEWELSR